jgi:hypothetical protein
MSNLIVMPDGNGLTPELIKSVSFFKGKKGLCVVCQGAQQRIIACISVRDEATGKRVRDILIQLTADGQKAVQPDWSFLEEDAS